MGGMFQENLVESRPAPFLPQPPAVASLLARAAELRLLEAQVGFALTLPRVLRRAQQRVHLELRSGLCALAGISSIAPFVGVFGTVAGISNSFPGCGGSAWACRAAVVEGLSDSLIPTALGLLVAIPAHWMYRYCCARMEAFNLEMSNAADELVGVLIRVHRRASAVKER